MTLYSKSFAETNLKFNRQLLSQMLDHTAVNYLFTEVSLIGQMRSH